MIHPELSVMSASRLGIRQVSPVWALFRCYAASPERQERFEEACKLINSGEYSAHEVAEETGISVSTVYDIRKKINAYRDKNGLGEILCPCGKPQAGHRFYCWFRLTKAPKRKAYLEHIKNWKHPQTNGAK